MMMEKKEKVIAARAASAPCENPLVSVVLCHWFARKQKATNHRKARKPAGEHSCSVLVLPSTSAAAQTTEVFHRNRDFGRRGPISILKMKQRWKEICGVMSV